MTHIGTTAQIVTVFFLSLFLLNIPLPVPACAQQFTEVNDADWGIGIDGSAPLIIDIDGNGLYDMLVGAQTGLVWRLEQTVSTSIDFQLITRNFAGIDVQSEAIPTAGDIDGDGRIDLFIGSNNGNIAYYVQKAPGSLAFDLVTKKFLNIDVGAHATPHLTDLEDDGRWELLIGQSSGPIALYRQNAKNDTVFSLVGLTFLSPPATYTSVFARDFNGDGKKDLIVGTGEGQAMLYVQDAVITDSFALVQGHVLGLDSVQLGVFAAADVDHDGWLDLFEGDNTGWVQMYQQIAQGPIRFQRKANYKIIPIRDAGYRASYTIADIDHDGLLDVFTIRSFSSYTKASQPSLMYRYEQDSKGSTTFRYQSGLPNIPTDSYGSACFTDIDGDGLVDLLLGDKKGTFKWYEQRQGSGSQFDLVNPEFNAAMQVNGNAAYPCVTDLDGNGRLDLLIGASGGKINHYEQNAPHDSLFTLVTDTFSGISNYFYPWPTVLDFDNDGLLDLFIGDYTGTIRQYEQDASGSRNFTLVNAKFAGVQFPRSMGAFPLFHDVNDDGVLDMFVGDLAGGISLFLGAKPDAILPPDASLDMSTLYAGHPNPASLQTTIRFSLQHEMPVTLELCDMLGRTVRSVINGSEFSAGIHEVVLQCADLPAGVYVYRLLAGKEISERALTITR